MPKDILALIMVITLTVMMTHLGVTYALEDARNKDVVNGLTETANITAIESFDYSSRVDRGTSFISKEDFEKNFVTNFKKEVTTDVADSDFKFEYLNSDGDENIKAARVTAVDNRGESYTSTVVVDISN